MFEHPFYDVVVIGGGHAGAEAAWAAANLGAHTVMITMDPAKIGAMSCNPAIGGLAKGQMVREIDALGGLMGLAADATGIQFRVLNASKGPAVQGPRCQSDKYRYAKKVQQLLATREHLQILTGIVETFEVRHGRITAVVTKIGRPGHVQMLRLQTKAVVLTTGTFMRGLMHTGQQRTQGGRVGEPAANNISTTLQQIGFELGRLKTGTPPRLDSTTIDFDRLPIQQADRHPQPFSDMTPLDHFPQLEQRHCWVTHTNHPIHEAIRANLDRAPMYNGQIETAGPRYCPSIEDKVVRFADRKAHHVYLEPESLDTNEIYCNGISTSLPSDVQDQIVRQLPSCERARILRYGYAVEYDVVWPHQIDATCMTKHVEGLFLAGQINGTSGYEEAAGQGLLAGLNSVRYLRNDQPIRLGRDEAYLGVMMDDLVTKTPREPYRMFTSRAEFRLLLRGDNADQRLTPLGRRWGLVDGQRWRSFESRAAAARALHEYISDNRIETIPMSQWVLRQEVDADAVLANLNSAALPSLARNRCLIARVLADLRYAGYIERQRREVDRLADQEHTLLPTGADFGAMAGLRNEAKDVLERFRPRTLGQAARLAGITPADVMVLSVAVKK